MRSTHNFLKVHESHINIEWTLFKDFNSLNNKGTSNLVKLVPRELKNGGVYRGHQERNQN